MSTVARPRLVGVAPPPEPIAPANVQAEASILAAALADADVRELAVGSLRPEDFWRDSHGIIFGIVADLHRRGLPVDAITLADELTRRGQLGRVGNLAGLAETLEVEALPHHAAAHVQIIREKAAGRRMLDAIDEIRRGAFDGIDTVADMAARLRPVLADLEAVAAGGQAAKGYAGLADEDLGIIDPAKATMRPIRWLWKHRFAAGKLSLVAGEGGLAKSVLSLAIGGLVANGSPLPDGSGTAPQGMVIILSAEDEPEDTILPRLAALGVDPAMVRPIRAEHRQIARDGTRVVLPQTLASLEYWRAVFGRLRPTMMVIDPLPAYVGRGVNDHKNADVWNVLTPFLDLAAEFGVAVVGITHVSKAGDAKTARDKIIGSVAYINKARNVHVVLPDPDTPGRCFLCQIKANNAPADLPAIAYRIEPAEVPSPEGPIETVTIRFEDKPADVDPDALARQGKRKPGPAPSKKTAHARWLVDHLRGRPGWTRLGEVVEAAGEAGIVGERGTDGKWTAINALYRARDAVPELDGDHAGQAVEDMKADDDRGYPRTYWRLADGPGTPDTPY